MSSRKRRNARKIAMLVRMDATRSRMQSGLLLSFTGLAKGFRYWESCMKPLAKALSRRGLRERTIIALKGRVKDEFAQEGRHDH